LEEDILKMEETVAFYIERERKIAARIEAGKDPDKSDTDSDE